MSWWVRIMRLGITGIIAGTCLLMAQAAVATCSNYVGAATLNEVFRGSGSSAGRFAEIKLLSSVPSAIYQNWTLRFCHATPATCTNVLLGTAQVAAPYLTIVEQPDAAYYDFNVMDLALLDQQGKVIDYLSTGTYNTQQADLDCTDFVYDTTSGTVIQNSFTLFRMPDGTGLWQQSPGNSADETPVEQNDYNDPDYTPSDIVAAISSVTVAQGAAAAFTITLSSPTGALPDYPYTVNWATYDHSALAGTDYVAASGTLTITTGYSATISVNTLVSGATLEKLFYVALDAPSEGLLDPQVATATILPSSALHHYELSLATNAINCLPTTVTVTACASSSSPCTSPFTALAGQTAALTASAGNLAATTVAFDASGHATTTLSYPAAADGATVTVSLSGEQTPATFPRQCCPDGSNCVVADSCSTTFSNAGFIVAANADGPVTAIATQVAGVASANYYLRAVHSSSSGETCEGALTGIQSVDFAYECNNPASCYASNLLTIAGTAPATTISRNPAGNVSSYLPVNLTFDTNGNAPFALTYYDVGQVTLHVRKLVGASWLTGTSNAFVVKPHHFTLDIPGNPGTATDATGALFKRAGESFPVSVTAQTAGNTITPNYGKEAIAETVALVPALQAPSGGTLRPLVGGFGVFGVDCAGAPAAPGTACGLFQWPEVGIITLTPTVGDGNYLGAGMVSGTTLANIGRFYPAAFVLTHAATAGCGAGFTYGGMTGVKTGQPFAVSGVVAAHNMAGEITTNYTGAFARLTPSGLTALPLLSGTPATGTLTWTVDSLLFSNGSGTFLENDARYAFAQEGAPQLVYLRISALDSDGVTGSEDNPATAREYRSGRLRLHNAYGSEIADINVPFLAEYYTADGYYTRNTDDGCTMLTLAAHLQLRNPQTGGGTWQSGTTSMTIGSSTTAALPLQSPLLNGDAGLWFTAPGLGNTGYVELRTQLQSSYPWLTYGWNCDPSAPREACGRVDFGRYLGSPRHIYLRERY